MLFQVGIGSVGGTMFFSGGNFYRSANYDLPVHKYEHKDVSESIDFEDTNLCLPLALQNNYSLIAPNFRRL